MATSTKLPRIISPALLSSIRAHPQLPHHSWYFIAGVTLSVLNRPDEIPLVFKSAIKADNDDHDRNLGYHEQLYIARRMREALVKSVPIGGLPKAINSLLALKSATPVGLLDEPLAYSPTSRSLELHNMALPTILQRGQAFFDRIYGKVSRRVMRQLDGCGTEDLGIVARLLYGYILSNTSILNAAESSFVLLAGLIPQDVNPQLKGHLKGALNSGATVSEVEAVQEVVMKICKASGMTGLNSADVRGWGWRQPVAKL